MSTAVPTIPSVLVNLIIKDAQLGDNNFSTWKDKMRSFFAGIGASYLLTEKPGSVPEGMEVFDGQLCFVIINTLEDQHRYLVSGLISALEAWKRIMEHFQKSTMPRRLKAREDFYRVEHDPTQSIYAYIFAVEKASKALVDLGCKVQETETKDVLLMNLHSSYHTVRTSILTAQKEPSLAEVKSILSGSSGSAVAIKSEPVEVAMAARVHGRHPGRAQPQPQPQPQPQHYQGGDPHPVDQFGFRWCDPTNNDHCHRCGRPGHIAAKCITNMPQEVIDWILNSPARRGRRTSRDDVAVAATMVGVDYLNYDSDGHSGYHSPHSRSSSPAHSYSPSATLGQLYI